MLVVPERVVLESITLGSDSGQADLASSLTHAVDYRTVRPGIPDIW